MSQDLIDTAVSQALTTPAATQALIGKLLELPQAPIQITHIYGPGVTMREMCAKAGTLIVGRQHRGPHDVILVRGALVFFNPDGTQTRLEAPYEGEGGPGRKVARVEEDCTFVNVFHVEQQDVAALEAAVFADEGPEDTRPMLTPDGDYERVLAEQGATAEPVRAASERTDDLGPYPYGAYKVRVGRSLIEGHGLIATADIARGERIAPGTWNGKRTPAGRYTNHARDPNAAFVYDAVGIAWLAALRPIAGCAGGFGGEEITVDYRRTPRARWENLS